MAKTLAEVVEQINRDKYPTLETIINHIIQSKTIELGLFVIDFVGEDVKAISVYDKSIEDSKNYDIIVAKKNPDWFIQIATEEQRSKFIEVIKTLVK